MKIVVLDGYTLNPGDLSWNGLAALGQLEVYDRTPAERVAERIAGAEIVFTNKTVLSRNVFEHADTVRFLGVLATGYNVVDVAAAREFGVTVCNVPAYGTDSVAQFTIALILELCHRIGAHDAAVHSGGWARSGDFCFWNSPLVELAGKTLGIVGYGSIGRKVAAIAQAMGMRILYFNRTRLQDQENESLRYAELDSLFAEADVISLHCPLSDANRGMINARSLSSMKPGAFLVNTARGLLIDEAALADALTRGVIAGAALDVACVEPIGNDNPLLTAPNCIITPHIAWAPIEARSRLMEIAVDNLRQFLAGSPVNVVS